MTDLKRDYVRTHYTILDEADLAALNQAFRDMEDEARGMLAATSVAEADWRIARAADLRYTRQAYELTVPVQAGTLGGPELELIASDFHERHRQTYGHDSPGEAVQLVNLRITATGMMERLDLAVGSDAEAAPTAWKHRTAYFPGHGALDCVVLAREGLSAGQTIQGPAIIEAMDTTIVIPPEWCALAHDKGYIVMDFQANGETP